MRRKKPCVGQGRSGLLGVMLLRTEAVTVEGRDVVVAMANGPDAGLDKYSENRTLDGGQR
jgi:hypothetical protein